jgi:phosphatidylserine/phosphatidylglycerophosphate/cardiolipin synthase-like enzyme
MKYNLNKPHNTLVLLFILLGFYANAQVINISEARTKSKGSTVTIKGIVTNGDELGIIRYLQDATGGYAAYGNNLSSLNSGDEVELTGTVSDFNLLKQLSPVSNVKVLSTNNPIPTPKVSTFDAAFIEANESQLFKFENVTFKDPTGSFKGQTNYKVLQGGVEQEIRINGTSPTLVGKVVPNTPVTLIGIMSRFQQTFQILPRTIDDIQAPGPVINTKLVPKNITETSLTLTYTTQNEGNTVVKYGLTSNLELGEISNSSLTTNHEVEISNLSASTIYYCQALSTNNGVTSTGPVQLFITKSLSTGRIQPLFNSAIDASFATENNNAVFVNRAFHDTLAKYISNATETVDINIYNIDNREQANAIITALNNAFDKGIRVRVISDGDATNSGLSNLRSGIGIIRSKTGIDYGIMHNKAIIIDANSQDPKKPIVITGSTNYTEKQLLDDPNNLIIIQDQSLAKVYTLEFNEMFGSEGAQPNNNNAKFGPDKKDNTPHFLNIAGTKVEVYFSPTDGTTAEIIKQINNSNYEIYLGLNLATRSDIRSALRGRFFDDNIYMAAIFGDTNNNQSSVFTGIEDLYQDKIRLYNGIGLFHHKYMINDPTYVFADARVLTGSHNWSNNAENRNDENTLIIYSHKIANQYYQNWSSAYKTSGGTEFFQPSSVRNYTKNQDFTLEKVYWDGSQLSFTTQTNINRNVTLTLCDVNGKLVYQKNLMINNGLHQHNINTELSHGVYILNMNSNEINYYVKTVR